MSLLKRDHWYSIFDGQGISRQEVNRWTDEEFVQKIDFLTECGIDPPVLNDPNEEMMQQVAIESIKDQIRAREARSKPKVPSSNPAPKDYRKPTTTRDDKKPATSTRDDRKPATSTRDDRKPETSTRDDKKPAARDDRKPATASRDDRKPTTSTRDDKKPTVATREDRKSTTSTRDDRKRPPPTTETVQKPASKRSSDVNSIHHQHSSQVRNTDKVQTNSHASEDKNSQAQRQHQSRQSTRTSAHASTEVESHSHQNQQQTKTQPSKPSSRSSARVTSETDNHSRHQQESNAQQSKPSSRSSSRKQPEPSGHSQSSKHDQTEKRNVQPAKESNSRQESQQAQKQLKPHVPSKPIQSNPRSPATKPSDKKTAPKAQNDNEKKTIDIDIPEFNIADEIKNNNLIDWNYEMPDQLPPSKDADIKIQNKDAHIDWNYKMPKKAAPTSDADIGKFKNDVKIDWNYKMPSEKEIRKQKKEEEPKVNDIQIDWNYKMPKSSSKKQKQEEQKPANPNPVQIDWSYQAKNKNNYIKKEEPKAKDLAEEEERKKKVEQVINSVQRNEREDEEYRQKLAKEQPIEEVGKKYLQDMEKHLIKYNKQYMLDKFKQLPPEPKQPKKGVPLVKICVVYPSGKRAMRNFSSDTKGKYVLIWLSNNDELYNEDGTAKKYYIQNVDKKLELQVPLNQQGITRPTMLNVVFF